MKDIYIGSETGRLQSVILGRADGLGGVPDAADTYDPKSFEHIQKGTYPREEDMISEIEAFAQVLKKHHVDVYRPLPKPGLNQIFTRDIGFVIEDYFFKSNMLPDRQEEYTAIDYLLSQIAKDKLIVPPKEAHIEGGDVIVHGDWLFVGTYLGSDYPELITARTNPAGVQFLKDFFPQKNVKGFDLSKSNTIALDNALHLDCCFQPVGDGLAILHREGFRDIRDFEFLLEFFGVHNVLQISKQEMYDMMSNVFSIAPNVVVSESRFSRLNRWLRSKGIEVEEVAYYEIGKQEGLLRCSTLPLLRR